MVELRWAVPAETTTKAPRLQYRILGVWPSAPGDWMDVPWVVVKDEPPKPAPTWKLDPATLCTCRDGYGHPPCPVHAGVALPLKGQPE